MNIHQIHREITCIKLSKIYIVMKAYIFIQAKFIYHLSFALFCVFCIYEIVPLHKGLSPESMTNIQTQGWNRTCYLADHYFSVSFVGSSCSDFSQKLVFHGTFSFFSHYELSMSNFLPYLSINYSAKLLSPRYFFAVQMTSSILSISSQLNTSIQISHAHFENNLSRMSLHLSLFTLSINFIYIQI